MSTFGQKSFLAAADLSTKRYYVMKQTSDTEVNVADSATGKLVGTLYNDPRQGEEASIDGVVVGKHRTALVKLGGTVAFGDRLTTNGSGKAIKTTTTGNVVIGIAMQDGVADDIIEYGPTYFVLP